MSVSRGPMTTVVGLTPFARDEVEEVRVERDWSARAGVRAHITLLGPFLPPSEVTDTVLADLRHVFSTAAAIAVSLNDLRLLRSAACLMPERAEGLEVLSERLQATWPQVPRLHLQHHLTVARDCDEDDLKRLRTRFAPLLPLHGEIAEATLMERDDEGRVREVGRFPFGAQATADTPARSARSQARAG